MATRDRLPPGSWPATTEALNRLAQRRQAVPEELPADEGQRIHVTSAPTCEELHAALTFLLSLLAPELRRSMPLPMVAPTGDGYAVGFSFSGVIDHDTAARIVEAARGVQGG